ncbi:unnamed protein product [Triticum turgidum subsp. durum]|uniref:Homeobox domain-containing protein n=1 Tax=Triticum turgidum subsp. durum TaxID=4567 RepID=A0A9R0W206_TRITD|nr:unnamed protein product [Triticum turgidum subsp. durum]
MDRLPLPGGGPRAAANTPFFVAMDQYAASTSASPPEKAPAAAALPAPEHCGKSSYNKRSSDTIKAKIMSHPLYPALLGAFIDCRKVGAPPEVVGRLSSLVDELRPNSAGMQEQPADPELDQFMTYRDMLVMYSQELTRQIQEANQFLRSAEAHIDSFAPATGDNNDECGGSSSEDEQETCDVAGLPSGKGKQLKSQPLDKYSGYLRGLWRELSGKKKKKKSGRLPREARQRLLHWWQLHQGWPYPSEPEKQALAESTGLDTRQINNWFINQRKRHWRQAPPATSSRLQHINAGASSSSSPAVLGMEGQHFTGRSGYPDGGPLRL